MEHERRPTTEGSPQQFCFTPSVQQDEEPHSERKKREGKNNRGILAQVSLDDIISLFHFPDVTPGWFMLVSACLGLAMSRNTMLVD